MDVGSTLDTSGTDREPMPAGSPPYTDQAAASTSSGPLDRSVSHRLQTFIHKAQYLLLSFSSLRELVVLEEE
jgi:hypothetical protein